MVGSAICFSLLRVFPLPDTVFLLFEASSAWAGARGVLRYPTEESGLSGGCGQSESLWGL